MNYKLKTPCKTCPFRKEGGIRLTKGRAREIIATTGNPGAEFACHSTVDYDAEDDDGDVRMAERRGNGGEQHCVGALIFGDKRGTSSQMARIAERLGMYDSRTWTGRDEVFDTPAEMLKASIGGRAGRE